MVVVYGSSLFVVKTTRVGGCFFTAQLAKGQICLGLPFLMARQNSLNLHSLNLNIDLFINARDSLQFRCIKLPSNQDLT